MAEKTDLESEKIREIERDLLALSRDYFNASDLRIQLLKGDGSDRRIFLISAPSSSLRPVIGVFHENLEENRSFITLSEKMKSAAIAVPEVILVDQSESFYLLQYLGEYHLGQWIEIWKSRGEEEKILLAYQLVIKALISIQDRVTPLAKEFLKQRKMTRKDFEGDLAYFERDFVRRFSLEPWYSEKVRNELTVKLVEPISRLQPSVFVYRDFQSRNIMWHRNQPWFIDYQSAYLGTPFYDLASLLYASCSGLDENSRGELIRYYYEKARPEMDFEDFSKHLYRFVLIRRLRSLGSYGFLSVVKKKVSFYNAIMPGLEGLESLLFHQQSLQDFNQTREMIRGFSKEWKLGTIKVDSGPGPE
jgi:N-acetylmuramate 1-kinase